MSTTEAAIQAERDRALAILTHPEAAGRSRLTLACIDSGLTVEHAAAMLATAGKTTAATSTDTDWAAIAKDITATRAKNAAEIAAVPGVSAALAEDLARQGLTAEHVREHADAYTQEENR